MNEDEDYNGPVFDFEHIKNNFNKDTDKLFDELFEIYRKKHSIICPYCNQEQSESFKYDYVTYWGEDGKHDATCSKCNEKFYVTEIIDRTWKTNKLEDAKEEKENE